MIMQVLVGTKMIEVDQQVKQDRVLYEAATKRIIIFKIIRV